MYRIYMVTTEEIQEELENEDQPFSSIQKMFVPYMADLSLPVHRAANRKKLTCLHRFFLWLFSRRLIPTFTLNVNPQSFQTWAQLLTTKNRELAESYICSLDDQNLVEVEVEETEKEDSENYNNALLKRLLQRVRKVGFEFYLSRETPALYQKWIKEIERNPLKSLSVSAFDGYITENHADEDDESDNDRPLEEYLANGAYDTKQSGAPSDVVYSFHIQHPVIAKHLQSLSLFCSVSDEYLVDILIYLPNLQSLTVAWEQSYSSILEELKLRCRLTTVSLMSIPSFMLFVLRNCMSLSSVSFTTSLYPSSRAMVVISSELIWSYLRETALELKSLSFEGVIRNNVDRTFGKQTKRINLEDLSFRVIIVECEELSSLYDDFCTLS